MADPADDLTKLIDSIAKTRTAAKELKVAEVVYLEEGAARLQFVGDTTPTSKLFKTLGALTDVGDFVVCAPVGGSYVILGKLGGAWGGDGGGASVGVGFDYIIAGSWSGAEGAVVDAVAGTKIYTTIQQAADDAPADAYRSIWIDPNTTAGPLDLTGKTRLLRISAPPYSPIWGTAPPETIGAITLSDSCELIAHNVYIDGDLKYSDWLNQLQLTGCYINGDLTFGTAVDDDRLASGLLHNVNIAGVLVLGGNSWDVTLDHVDAGGLRLHGGLRIKGSHLWLTEKKWTAGIGAAIYISDGCEKINFDHVSFGGLDANPATIDAWVYIGSGATDNFDDIHLAHSSFGAILRNCYTLYFGASGTIRRMTFDRCGLNAGVTALGIGGTGITQNCIWGPNTPIGTTYPAGTGDKNMEAAGAGGDAADVAYTPAVAADWNGGVDPGNVDDALDQLAARIKALESA